MDLIVQDASADLPPDRDRGFKILTKDGDVLMFFHWTSDPQAVGITRFEDVLAALPQRLEEHGYDDQQAQVIGQVMTLYNGGKL